MKDNKVYLVISRKDEWFDGEGELTFKNVVAVCGLEKDANSFRDECIREEHYSSDITYNVVPWEIKVPRHTPATNKRISEIQQEVSKYGMTLEYQEDKKKAEEE